MRNVVQQHQVQQHQLKQAPNRGDHRTNPKSKLGEALNLLLDRNVKKEDMVYEVTEEG